MMLVPLLVGATILFVALSARLDWLKESRELTASEPAHDPAARGDSPLVEAFPHLQLWIPSGDAIYRATHSGAGSKGPDIVLRPRVTQRQLSDAA